MSDKEKKIMTVKQCPYCGLVYGEENGHDPAECYNFCLQRLEYIAQEMAEATEKLTGAYQAMKEQAIMQARRN